MSGLLGEIVFPPEWKQDREWASGFPAVVLHSDDETMFAAGGVLEDGTNLMGLCWPGGQRVYRLSPDTGWALEERYQGDAPKSAARAWRILVEAAIKAGKDVEDEIGPFKGLTADDS